MGHPSLGDPPTDFRAAFPAAAERLRANRAAIAARALEGAVANDPTLTERHDELGLRHLLRDTDVYVERLAMALGSGQSALASDWAAMCVPLYRRRHIPMDDLISISEGLRRAVRGFLGPDELPLAEAAIDEVIVTLKWNRRVAGDARKRNRILQLIYKGA